MKITLVGATPYELEGLIEHHFPPELEIDYLVHGVGAIHTTYNLTSYLCNHHPDLILQCGVAGTFNADWNLGDVVFVRKDQFADLGSEDQDGSLLDTFDLELEGHHVFPFREKKLINPLKNSLGLPEADAITVNTCSGSDKTVNYRKSLFKADLETMEGAALAYVCLQKHIRFAQIRGISNYVEPRNRDAWEMKKAIQNYTDQIIQHIAAFKEQ